MKLFTGSLAAGLVLLAGGAQAQVPGPYENGRPPYTAASDFDAPDAVAPQPVPGPQYGPGPRYGYSPSLLPSTEVYSVLRDNGFSPLGIPRLRGFVYTIAAHRPRRRGRTADYRRAQRPDHPLPAGLPHGRRQLLRGAERPPRALRGSAAAGPSAGTGPGPGRAAAVTAGPMLRAARCRCRRPIRSPPSLRRADPAGGSACAEAGRGAGGRPGDNRFGSSQARPADCTDPGHAHDAGAGVNRSPDGAQRIRGPLRWIEYPDCAALHPGYERQKTPRSSRGVFIAACELFALRLRRPGSGRRPCRAARPATGGRRPVRPSSHSSAWPETARGRD